MVAQKQQDAHKKNSKVIPTPTEYPAIKLSENINQYDINNSFDKLNIPGLINGTQNIDQVINN